MGKIVRGHLCALLGDQTGGSITESPKCGEEKQEEKESEAEDKAGGLECTRLVLLIGCVHGWHSKDVGQVSRPVLLGVGAANAVRF